MKRVSVDGVTYAAPFEKLFRPLTDAERTALRTSIALRGVLNPVLAYTSPAHGRALIDGIHRVEESGGQNVPVINLGELSDSLAEAMARELNYARRHLTRDEAERVAADMRGAGASVRAIAARTELPIGTVHRILGSLNSGVPYGTPDDEPATTTGRDGKEYPAKKLPPAPEIPTDELSGIDLTLDPARIDAAEQRYLAELAVRIAGVNEMVLVLMDLKGPRSVRFKAACKKCGVPVGKAGVAALAALDRARMAAAG